MGPASDHDSGRDVPARRPRLVRCLVPRRSAPLRTAFPSNFGQLAGSSPGLPNLPVSLLAVRRIVQRGAWERGFIGTVEETSRDSARRGLGHRRADREHGGRGHVVLRRFRRGEHAERQLQDGATYPIQCPAGAWNGTLYLYSHGYVVPGAATRPPMSAIRSPAPGCSRMATRWRARPTPAPAGPSSRRCPIRSAPSMPSTALTASPRRPSPGVTRWAASSPPGCSRTTRTGSTPPSHVRRPVRRRGHLEHRA